MNIFYKYNTFYLSYTPLWASILFVDMMSLFEDKTPTPWTERISITLIVVAYIFAVLNVTFSIKGLSKASSEIFTIKHCREDKAVAMEYLLSYIVPMFAFDFTLWRQVVLFLIYYFVLGFLCIKHNLLVANVAFEIAGYRFYHVDVEDSLGFTVERNVMSHEKLTSKVANVINLVSINGDVYCDVTKKCDNSES